MAESSPSFSVEISTTPAAIPIRAIGQIIVRVSDLNRSVRFYQEVLGFAEAEDQMLAPGMTLVAGDVSIYVTEGATARGNSEAAGYRIALIVASAKAAYEQAQQAGVTIVDEYDGTENFGSFTIEDPDGAVVELWGRP